MDDAKLRENVVELLERGSAHVSARKALAKVGPAGRSARAGDGVRSAWEELEHMRIAQEDILRYALDPAWRSPAFPEGYWPDPSVELTAEMWDASVTAFLRGLDEVVRLVRDADVDLTAEIPHGEGRTYLRQALLVADHNAYHLGQIVQALKVAGEWPA
jgi:hypothetical protein